MIKIARGTLENYSNEPIKTKSKKSTKKTSKKKLDAIKTVDKENRFENTEKALVPLKFKSSRSNSINRLSSRYAKNVIESERLIEKVNNP